MASVEHPSTEELTRALTYAGLVLVGFELVRSMIVNPVKVFYANSTFEGGPFKSYQKDTRSRHENEFEACLLYLQDFMGAIDSEDRLTIQALRKLRNDVAHDLVGRLPNLEIDRPLFEKVAHTLFKLSNYRARMELGAEPELQDVGIDWEKLRGHEYLLFENVLEKVKLLDLSGNGA